MIKNNNVLKSCLTVLAIYVFAPITTLLVFAIIIGMMISGAIKNSNEFKKTAAKSSTNVISKIKGLEIIRDCGTAQGILQIKISDIIRYSEEPKSYFSDVGKSVIEKIDFAIAEENIKAILIIVDSPGGEVTACDEIYNMLLRFKKSRADRKVFALFKSVAASGAYYIACASDHIMSMPTAVIGSIGVRMSTFNVYNLITNIGISEVTVKSGNSKDLLNPFQPSRSNDLEIIQKIVDDMFTRFTKIVSNERKIDLTNVLEIADGRVMTANDALNCKLIDSIGYIGNYYDKIDELLGEKLSVAQFAPKITFSSIFEYSISKLNLRLPFHTKPDVFYYLWSSSEL